MIYKNDWRLKRQRKYLEGVTLRWRQFQAFRPDSDSDHCEFCWAKFHTLPRPDVLNEGYASDDNYYWICKNCFDDFQDLFHWKISEGPGSD